ncbi:hypothetical protein A0123_00217 [Gluconobacter cerinus]|uniref:Uncharacterized protein n=2 Tax=Gluconobacter cerinus TaxID=38307 RepID=A0A1B6VPN0_9PROT|nr:hypothetical protein A0123_00217 [Gluconobacter cerinus]
MRRLLNLPGQSCGPSGEARSTTAASHPAFSLTVAVPVRKATARPSAAGVRPASAAGPHATPHQPQACPPCSGRSGLDGLSRRPSWPVAGWAQENATVVPLSSPSMCSPHGQDGSRKTTGIHEVIKKSFYLSCKNKARFMALFRVFYLVMKGRKGYLLLVERDWSSRQSAPNGVSPPNGTSLD